MKKILCSLIIILLVTTIPTSLAQEITIGEPAKQKLIEVIISIDGDVHVRHIVEGPNKAGQIELIDGTKTNLDVHDEDGEEKQHAIIGNNDAVLILPTEDDVIVEYDLGGVLELKDNLWIWDFRYLESTTFYFPENIDLIFANNRPVFLGEKEGIVCHGCQMKLEYSINEPSVVHDVEWENQEFIVITKTHGNIDSFSFDQPSKSISFNVESDNDFVTAVIPLELLWEPYQVYLEDEKIFFNKYLNNGTHAWLNFRPDTSGNITIIGTTVVPEFPVVLLVLSLSMITIIPLVRKFNLR